MVKTNTKIFLTLSVLFLGLSVYAIPPKDTVILTQFQIDSIAEVNFFGESLGILKNSELELQKLDSNLNKLKSMKASEGFLKKSIQSYDKKIRIAQVRIRNKTKRENYTKKLMLQLEKAKKKLKDLDSLSFNIASHYKDLKRGIQHYVTLNKSFYYNLNLSQISVLFSQDSLVRLYSWQSSIGSDPLYHAIFQIKTQEGYKIFDLEKIGTEEIFVDEQYSSNEWKGAIYFDLVSAIINGESIYLVFGWQPSVNQLTQVKLIESFKYSKGQLEFGQDIIKKDNELLKRIIFKYSAGLTMGIKYEQEYNLVTFDHLNTEDTLNIGKYEYYGPDLSYDAIKFENNNWNFISDFDLNTIIKQPKDELPF